MDEVRYMISEASKRVEVKDHVLRYWEEQLEMEIDRNEMGHRYYKDADIEQLKIIRQMMDQGFQLKAIKLLLPNLHKVNLLDDQTRIRLKEELNGKVIEMYGVEDEKEDTVENAAIREVSLEEETEDKISAIDLLVTEKMEEETCPKVVLLEDVIKEKTNIEKSIIEKMAMEAEVKEEGLKEEGCLKEGTGLMSNEEARELKEDTNKVVQFKTIMNAIILEALKENNSVLSRDISANVTDGVIKEMSFLMRVKEEKEEERFKKFDATLRDYQKTRMMTASSLEGKSKKKSKFMKKNKVYI